LTGCSLCKFFNEPYNSVKKQIFEAKINEGYSLRKLRILLEAWGIQVSKDTIGRHLRNCLNVKTKESLVRTVKEAILNEKPLLPEHHVYVKCLSCGRPIKWSDNGEVFVVLCEKRVIDERVYEICPSCKKPISDYGYDPEQLEILRNTEKLYRSLRR